MYLGKMLNLGCHDRHANSFHRTWHGALQLTTIALLDVISACTQLVRRKKAGITEEESDGERRSKKRSRSRSRDRDR